MTDRSLYYRDPAVYFATASSYLDAMDYIDFMQDQGWQILVPPFVVSVDPIPVYKFGKQDPDWIENPTEWGFVLHKFHITDVI